MSAATKVKESRRDAERLPRRLWARDTKKGGSAPPPPWGSRRRVEPIQLRRVDIRTAAGPSSAVQWVLIGGPYTV